MATTALRQLVAAASKGKKVEVVPAQGGLPPGDPDKNRPAAHVRPACASRSAASTGTHAFPLWPIVSLSDLGGAAALAAFSRALACPLHALILAVAAAGFSSLCAGPMSALAACVAPENALQEAAFEACAPLKAAHPQTRRVFCRSAGRRCLP